MKAMVVVLSLLMLGGCATNGPGSWSSPGPCAKLTDDQELSLSLADDLVTDGKLHAGLANLQKLPDSLNQVRFRKARVYRLLGRSEAEPLYRGLLGTCLAAEGEHGLGQLASAKGDNDKALVHLQRAAHYSPADEKIRNDLGVAYLNLLRINEARFEFITAMELKQTDQLAALNLVTLLIYQDNWRQASEVVSRAGLSSEQFASAQARAEQLKTKVKAKPAKPDQVATANNPQQPSIK